MRPTYIVAGLLEAFTSQGSGTALFERLDAWAHEQHIYRLELTVMVHNVRGVGLYQKAVGIAIASPLKVSIKFSNTGLCPTTSTCASLSTS